VAIPGERLARAGGLSEEELAAAEVFTLDGEKGLKYERLDQLTIDILLGVD
jgi:hypothetical protein